MTNIIAILAAGICMASLSNALSVVNEPGDYTYRQMGGRLRFPTALTGQKTLLMKRFGRDGCGLDAGSSRSLYDKAPVSATFIPGELSNVTFITEGLWGFGPMTISVGSPSAIANASSPVYNATITSNIQGERGYKEKSPVALPFAYHVLFKIDSKANLNCVDSGNSESDRCILKISNEVGFGGCAVIRIRRNPDMINPNKPIFEPAKPDLLSLLLHRLRILTSILEVLGQPDALHKTTTENTNKIFGKLFQM